MTARVLLAILAISVLFPAEGAQILVALPGGSLGGSTKALDPTARAIAAMTAQRKHFGRAASAESWGPARGRGGGERVRLQQYFHGLPVFAAEVLVHLDATRGATKIIAGIAQGLDSLGIPPPPATIVFDPALFGLAGPPRYAWTEDHQPRGADTAERVLFDAETGRELFHLPLSCSALERRIYDAANTENYPFTPTRAENGAAAGIADVDTAYDDTGRFYEFLFTHFDRDGLDGAGGALKCVVRYCSPDETCPYVNAFWYIDRAYFGEGFALADDVVGHELAHGLTANESGLVYFGQPGALNEAYSDIFGEFFDLQNGAGNDASEHAGEVGEDVPGIGAFRDLADPTRFNDPDATCSAFWYTGTQDGGGIHTNNGVINHLAWLLAFGGDFNGEQIDAAGTDAVLQLLYRVQTDYLIPTSGFEDFYRALQLATTDLGYTAQDTANLEAACRAVTITPWTTCQSIPTPPSYDDCAAAPTVTPGVPFFADSTGATGTFQSTCAPFELNDYRDVWFRFVASVDLTTITLGGALGFAPVLSVGADDCANYAPVACDYSGATSPYTAPLIQIATTPGTAYLVRVAGRDVTGGPFTLRIDAPTHTADQDADGRVSLSELLRVIQLYNAGGYHCDSSGEDGYAPGPGDTACVPHATDYNPQDWSLSLSEVLRAIQFYNAGAYATCPGTEDGFCPLF